MTSKPKSKQSSMFDTLAKKTEKRSSLSQLKPSITEIATDLKAQQGQASTVPKLAKTSRGRTSTGKRSDPLYTQVGCYLPRELNTKIKMKLIDDPRDFSDLVAELLRNWLTD
jgi:hypothetical protein